MVDLPPSLYHPIFSRVDWRGNIHEACNPYKNSYNIEELSQPIKEILSVPFTKQKSPLWLEWREDFESGSQAGSILDENEYQDFVLYRAGRIKKHISPFLQRAMDHGNFYEPMAIKRYLLETKDVGLEFGLIPHRNPKWKFLAASPDLVTVFEGRLAEVKNPFRRAIIAVDVDEIYKDRIWELDNQTQLTLLMREIIITGQKHRYLSLTNLPKELSGLGGKLIKYWHQMQLQAEVTGIKEDVDFVQHGTYPNRHYSKNDLLTITKVPVDENWISQYGDTLQKAWEEIQYYKNPDVVIPKKTSNSPEYVYPIVRTYFDVAPFVPEREPPPSLFQYKELSHPRSYDQEFKVQGFQRQIGTSVSNPERKRPNPKQPKEKYVSFKGKKKTKQQHIDINTCPFE